MGCYATSLISVHVRTVRDCGIRWGLPTPRITEDRTAFEMTAREVQAWTNYFEENQDNPQKIDGPTFLACTVMERDARDYISRKADEAPMVQPARIIFLRQATEEYRLFFM